MTDPDGTPEERGEHVYDLFKRGMDMLDPSLNTAYRVRPRWAFGLRADNFTGTPTRWSFER